MGNMFRRLTPVRNNDLKLSDDDLKQMNQRLEEAWKLRRSFSSGRLFIEADGTKCEFDSEAGECLLPSYNVEEIPAYIYVNADIQGKQVLMAVFMTGDIEDILEGKTIESEFEHQLVTISCIVTPEKNTDGKIQNARITIRCRKNE